MYNFNYQKAKSLAEASGAIGKSEDVKLLAGGMTLIPTLKQRLAKPSDLIDLGGLPELKGIKSEGDAIVIGAMTRHIDVAESAEVKKAIPALAQLAHLIGDPAVRNRGTIGGSISNNDPAADYPAAVVALNATVITNQRKIPGEQFFTGMFETALKPGEIVTAVSFPVCDKANYQKFRNPASRYAIVGVFVAEGPAGIRVAITGAGQGGVFRHTAMETALTRDFSANALTGIETSAEDLNADIHASAEYRAHLVGVMARRAVAGA
jgi:carbon-monoxide dehydrogenase medium subunit